MHPVPVRRAQEAHKVTTVEAQAVAAARPQSKTDRLAFWFSLLGEFLVKVPKGCTFMSRSLGSVTCGEWWRTGGVRERETERERER